MLLAYSVSPQTQTVTGDRHSFTKHASTTSHLQGPYSRISTYVKVLPIPTQSAVASSTLPTPSPTIRQVPTHDTNPQPAHASHIRRRYSVAAHKLAHRSLLLLFLLMTDIVRANPRVRAPPLLLQALAIGGPT